MDKEKISYLAGLFDGEGSITYKQYFRRWSKKPRPYKCWIIRMEVAMTNKYVIDYMHKILGVGTVRPKTKKTPPSAKTKWKDQWRWSCCFRDSLKVCKLFEPYAIVKLDQIKKIINHYEEKKDDTK